MIVKTLFHQAGKLELGHVEVKLLPGIPQLHIVGLPDASIRECGIKLKSAIRSCGLVWPQGQQIVVSLRPMDIRKGGAGVDLAIALAYLGVTGQLSADLRGRLTDHLVYGEVALNGEVHAPSDLDRVLKLAGRAPVLTGTLQAPLRDGEWWEIENLKQGSALARRREFDWAAFWRRPELPPFQIHEKAARHLLLALHMKLNVLLAGPQGSGKTTWARLLHALMPTPEVRQMNQLAALFGDEVLDSAWRPLEQPHHTITPQAMIGGGLPLQPGVISRAHGGLLVMDEFLHFHPQVLEALREPVESRYVELARSGARERFPADFQLVATTNLCPCGKLNPAATSLNCPYSLLRCRSVAARLSGPVLDRFDFLSLSHEWLGAGRLVPMQEILERLAAAQKFREGRPASPGAPEWTSQIGLSHRRRQSMAKVARGLADLEGSMKVRGRHTQEAFEIVVTPMNLLREIFA